MLRLGKTRRDAREAAGSPIPQTSRPARLQTRTRGRRLTHLINNFRMSSSEGGVIAGLPPSIRDALPIGRRALRKINRTLRRQSPKKIAAWHRATSRHSARYTWRPGFAASSRCTAVGPGYSTGMRAVAGPGGLQAQDSIVGCLDSRAKKRRRTIGRCIGRRYAIPGRDLSLTSRRDNR
jgi:hypothetical protein